MIVRHLRKKSLHQFCLESPWRNAGLSNRLAAKRTQKEAHGKNAGFSSALDKANKWVNKYLTLSPPLEIKKVLHENQSSHRKKWEPHAAVYSRPHGSVHRACTKEFVLTWAPSWALTLNQARGEVTMPPQGGKKGWGITASLSAGSFSRGELPLSILQNDPGDSCTEWTHGHS